jgi:hypothetical protein
LESNAHGPYGFVRDPRSEKREAAKIQLLAARVSLLAAETEWPTTNDLLRLEPEIVTMLAELGDRYDI